MAADHEVGRTFKLSTKQVLQGELEDFENVTREVFESFAKAYTQRGAKTDVTNEINKLVNQLIEKDQQIKTSLKTALDQLDKHKKIQKVRDEIVMKDQEILSIQRQLKEAENILATAIFQARKKLKATEQAKAASVSCEELIKFAFRISSGNSVEAPPDWVPGDPRRPYPLDIEMRCGALGQLSQRGTQHADNNSNATTRNVIDNDEGGKSMDIQDALLSQPNSTSSRNGEIWQGPPSEDTAHLETMPVSAMTSRPTNGGDAAAEEVEFMSTSSDSSSSGESN